MTEYGTSSITWSNTDINPSHYPQASQADRAASRAIDYQHTQQDPQSGLTYIFQDGLPLIPPPSLARQINLVAKRGLDIVGAILGTIMLSPFLIFIMLAIRLTSKGPALFTQTRIGQNGKLFRIYKFRSMYIDRCDISGVQQTVKNDPRVTPIGRFIRKTNIDELPQLINIIKGQMSLVGPRPHAVGMLAAGMTYESLVPYYTLRYLAKPGLTGWAQANSYRGPTDNAQKAIARIDHDIAYIQNFSIILDLKTIARTIKAEITHKNGF